jgi:V-type H+-transporting ATPase subunit F
VGRPDCGLVIINQPIADAIRPLVNGHTAIVPMVLEIPSKEAGYDPTKDPLMKRVLTMLGEV